MKVWSTTQVAGRLAAALGKHVTDAFVRDCYLAMHGLDPMGMGHHIQVTEADARLIIQYGVEWHGRPEAPGILAWATEHGHAVPALQRSRLPVPAAPRPEARAAAASASERPIINVLAARMDKLEKLVEQALSPGRKRATRQLTDRASGVGATLRRRLNKLVKSWTRDRFGAITYPAAWSNLYRLFFADLGEPVPEEWYRSQLSNDAKLDYFEQKGWLGVFVDAVPGFLVKMDEGLRVGAGQGELGI